MAAVNIYHIKNLDSINLNQPGIYVYSGNSKERFIYYITVGENTTERTNLCFVGGGKGGFSIGHDYRSNRLEMMCAQEDAVGVIAVPNPVGGNINEVSGWGTYVNNFMGNLSKRLRNAGEDISTEYFGYSQSAERTLVNAGEYVSNGGNVSNVVLVECSSAKQVRLLPQYKKALIKKNVVVINAYANPDNSMFNHYHFDSTQLEGIHILDLELKIKYKNVDVSRTSHAIVDDILVKGGIYNVGGTNFSFANLPTTYKKDGKKYTIEYSFTEHYLDSNNVYRKRKITSPLLADLIVAGYILDNETIKLFNSLRQIKPIEFLSSDLEFVLQKMNEIRSNAQNSVLTLFKSSNAFGSDASGIIANISNVTSTYLGYITDMHEKLATQTDVSVSAAKAYDDMDRDLSSNVGSIDIIPEDDNSNQ